MEDIYKSAGIIIHDKKLLVARTKDKEFFIAPGGRRQPGENDKQTIIRELAEELRVVVCPEDLEEFGRFSADAANHPGTQVHMVVFMVKSWQGVPTPDNEIEELRWIDSSTVADIPVGSIFAHDVLPQLAERGLVA